MTTRPYSVTLLALILGWLSVGGFVMAFLVTLEELPVPIQLDNLMVTVLKVCAFLYGAFALTSGIGLWQRSSWARKTIWCFMVSCAALFVVMMWVIPPAYILGGYIGSGFFGMIVIALFILLDRFVQRHLNHAAQSFTTADK